MRDAIPHGDDLVRDALANMRVNDSRTTCTPIQVQIRNVPRGYQVMDVIRRIDPGVIVVGIMLLLSLL